MINFLQQFVYQKLNKSEIVAKVTGVYTQVPNNTSFPYIYIGKFRGKDISTKDQELEQVSFKLVIYLRDKSLKAMLELSKDIIKLLQIEGHERLVSMRCWERDVEMQNDGQTIEITMKFRAILVNRESSVVLLD